MESRRCKQPNCKAWSLAHDDFCYFHSSLPQVAKAREEARRRGGRQPKRVARIKRSVSIEEMKDLRLILDEELSTLLSLPPSISRARALGYLLNQALRVIELDSIEARLKRLEELVQG